MHADAIARAIVAASKETGADPLDVASGNERSGGYSIQGMRRVSRARAYAGCALDRVFNKSEVTIARPVIARLIGVNKPSQACYLSALDGRPLPWFSGDVLGRVISAIEAGLVRPEPKIEPVATPEPPKPVQSSTYPVQSPPKTIQRPEPRRLLSATSGPYVPVGRPPRKDDDFLRQAVLNTQKLTPPPED